jgi:ATP-dependent RNA helicase DHX57
MMDIGSKGGYYDAKSPKLILHEWLLKEKQPKARYKTLPGPSSSAGNNSNNTTMWLAKVVLPHPKQQDKDMVVFLPEAYAADTDDEAQQRGAVAALHRIAGDRALERTLPPQYAALWRALGDAAKERKAKEVAVAERRAVQQAKQQAALKKRGPSTVIMAEDKRKLVEDILSEVRGGGGGGGGVNGNGESNSTIEDGWESFGRPDASATTLHTAEPPSALLDDLIVLGFSAEDAAQGVAAVLSSPISAISTNSTGGADLSAVLDWICLNIPESRLPTNFAPGAAGKPITIIRKNASTSSLPTFSSRPSSRVEGDVIASNITTAVNVMDDPAVVELTTYGYPPLIAAEALQQSRGNVHQAVQLLYRRMLTRTISSTSGAENNNPITTSNTAITTNTNTNWLEEWEEERIALEAIFESSTIQFSSLAWTSIKNKNIVLEGEAAETVGTYCGRSKEDIMMDGVDIELQIWAPPPATPTTATTAAAPYPLAVPTVALRCSDLSPQMILALTHTLAQASLEMVGRPMVYEIACLVQEVLPKVVVAAPQPLNVLLGLSSNSDDISTKDVEESLLADEVDTRLKLDASSSSSSSSSSSRGGNGNTNKHRKQNKSGGGGRRPYYSAAELAAENSVLLQHQNEMETSTKHASMRSQRANLPAFSKRQEAIASLSSSKVLVISGATGCGKSTQIPQYILENATSSGNGASCNVIITQPRRISAVGLASRVASERGEAVGQTVGYSVRLDSKQSKRTRLLFCTTGILLRRLLSDSALSGTSHVVLDEVHERSIESDLLLLLLRDLLVSGKNPELKVVLMSATADADLFANYFNQMLCANGGSIGGGGGGKNNNKKQSGRSVILSIPGFTHPVTDMFLEDALEATGFIVGKTSKWAKKSAGKKENEEDVESNDAAAHGGGGKNNYSYETIHSLRNIDESLVNYDLIEALIAHVAANSSLGNSSKNKNNNREANAILIFAPGADEISRIVRALENSSRLAAAAPGGIRALPLHGGLPPSHQTRVFERPPPGVLKIVVSTNVAETSITIDDVVCVIDTGRVKEMRFDAQRGIARLQETWVSQASAKQRRGRAGRVRPGVCYRLFSKNTWSRSMPVDTAPEVARAPLQALVMDVKGILSDIDASAALAKMISPPNTAAVNQAVTSLERVGALDPSSGALTPLGHHLTRMPCDPRVGKMLIFGAMLRCLDPILTVAAAQGHGRSVFFSPPDKREEAENAKRALVAHVASSKSDHLAVVAAYNGWRAALAKNGRSAASQYCSKSYISDQAMDAIHAGRRQYAEILADLGFCAADYPSDSAQASYNPGTASPSLASSAAIPSAAVARHTAQSGVDQFAGHARIVKAVLAAGLYPQLLRVDHPAAKYQKVLGGAVETQGEAVKVRFFDREKGRVFLHPSSINFTCGKFESGWLVYSDLVQTSKVFVREASMVPVYAVLLFGGEVSVHHGEGLVRVDGWATFRAPARIAVLVRELRAEVAALLGRKVVDPGLDVGSSRVVEAMHHLLSTDGF